MVDVRLKRFGLAAAAVAAGLSTPLAAQAQEFPFDFPPLIPNQTRTLSDVPNVPDARGCVKWCERDQSPCDPVLYKRADGRCNNVD